MMKLYYVASLMAYLTPQKGKGKHAMMSHLIKYMSLPKKVRSAVYLAAERVGHEYKLFVFTVGKSNRGNAVVNKRLVRNISKEVYKQICNANVPSVEDAIRIPPYYAKVYGRNVKPGMELITNNFFSHGRYLTMTNASMLLVYNAYLDKYNREVLTIMEANDVAVVLDKVAKHYNNLYAEIFG